MKTLRSAIVLMAAILIAANAFAQGRGRIDGRIADHEGKPLAGVQITAQKVGAEERAEAKSNEKGEFSLQKLSAGEWRLDFQYPGLEVPPATTEVVANKPAMMTVTMAPPDPMVEINADLKRAGAMMQSGDTAGARAIYENLYTKYPQPFQFPYAIATTYAAEKNYDKALEYAKIAAEKDPASVDVKMLTAEIHMEAGRREEAQAILESIDLKEVQDPLLFINAGIVLINNQKSEEAVRLFDRLIERFPTENSLYYYRGRAHLVGQNLPEAKADLEKFISLAPAAREAEDAKRVLAEIDKALSGKKDGGLL